MGRMQENFEAVTSGETDLYWSYDGTVLRQFVGDESSVDDAAEVYRKAKAVESKYDLVLGEATRMNNTWALSPRRVWCEEQDVHSLPDLAAYVRAGNDLSMAYDPDFRDRSDGLSGLAALYDFPDDAVEAIQANSVAYEEAAQRYETIDTGNVDMVQGLLADAWIDVHDLQPLADPDNYFFFYRPVPLVRGEAARTHPSLVDTVNRISPTIETAEEMRQLVRQVKIGKKDPRVVAREHLETNGLL
ncbi:glycine betaine ABC transporter substrate-binding protein [Haloarculaceae archaeon H-GB2-1]|nr:glycine betaine ABC transporter substrate-binding protein [Haloarculaceae archaeon H-GB11]MEA5409326.1 glycine betaine ABC transporter substrate-binding protein [Haloarculaceae archaeon H-GB2-1]